MNQVQLLLWFLHYFPCKIIAFSHVVSEIYKELGLVCGNKLCNKFNGNAKKYIFLDLK